MTRAYTALCNTTDRDQDLITALRWALDHSEDGQPVTLWCLDKAEIFLMGIKNAPVPIIIAGINSL